MAAIVSALGNTHVKRKNSNINLLFATNFNVSIDAPTNFHGLDNPASIFYVPTATYPARIGTVPINRDFVCDNKLSGFDAETGFLIPSGEPLFANSSIGYGIYCIDQQRGFPTNDRAGIDTTMPISIQDVVIRGKSTKALTLRTRATGAPIFLNPVDGGATRGFGQQLWYMFHRNLAALGAADLPRLLIGYDLKLPDFNLLGIFNTTDRRLAIFDVKAENDFRYIVSIIYANAADASAFGVSPGTLGWEIVCDNNANGSLTFAEFFRVKVYDVPVPVADFFRIEFYFLRAASFADLTGGRFLVRYKKQNDINYTTVWDQHAATNATYNALRGTSNVNRGMGVNGAKIHRIFASGQYGNYLNTSLDLETQIANFQMFDGLID